MSPRLLYALVLLAAPAFAQSFEDDFEQGLLPAADAGEVWSPRGGTAGVTLSMSNAAAHRGDAGMRVADNTGGSSPGYGAWLEGDLDPAMTFSQYYLRAWIRFTGTMTGDTLPLQLLSPTDAGARAEVLDALLIPLYYAEAYGGGYYSSGASVTSSLGTWQLVELGLTGIDGPDAGVTLWLDGTHAAEFPGAIDFTGAPVTRVVFGEPYSTDSSFTGTIDFDDVRGDTAPQASTLSVQGPSTIPPTYCAPFRVALTSSNGAAAGAPYAFAAVLTELAVADSGVSAFFSADNACSSMASAVPFVSGQTSANFWFHANGAGSIALDPSYADFISHAATVTVSPDAGIPDSGFPDAGAPDAGQSGGDAGADAGAPDAGTGGADAGALDGGGDGGDHDKDSGTGANLGCGCASSGATAALAALCSLLFLATSARARRRSGASPCRAAPSTPATPSATRPCCAREAPR